MDLIINITIIIFSFLLTYFWIYIFIFKRFKNLYHIIPVILFFVLFYLFFKNENQIIQTVYIAFTISAVFCGRFAAGSKWIKIEANRKELLTALLEFGHSGTITRNIDQIILYSTKLFKGDKIDNYAQKRLLESWRTFTGYSRYSITNLTRLARGAFCFDLCKNITGTLNLIIGKYYSFNENDLNIYKKQDDLIELLAELQKLLVKLEKTVDGFFCCKYKDVISRLADAYKKNVSDGKLDGIRLDISRIDSDYAKIDCIDLKFILNVLLLNAKKAVEKTDKKEISIKINSMQTRLFFRVSDTGTGIPEEQWGQVFYPGYSGFGRNGFDLYHSKEILLKYKGTLEVEKSVPGEGTTFLLVLRIPDSYV